MTTQNNLFRIKISADTIHICLFLLHCESFELFWNNKHGFNDLYRLWINVISGDRSP